MHVSVCACACLREEERGGEGMEGREREWDGVKGFCYLCTGFICSWKVLVDSGSSS